MANLESTLQENRLFEPAQDFSSKARLKNRDELEALRQRRTRSPASKS